MNNLQLRNWLSQFPDDAEIRVVATESSCYGYESYTSVFEERFEPPEKIDLSGYFSYYAASQFELGGYRNEDDTAMAVNTIILGRNG